MNQKIRIEIAVGLLISIAVAIGIYVWISSREIKTEVSTANVNLKKNNSVPIQKEEDLKKDDNNVVCTQDAKQCADGSYVSRTGPNCEFAECPQVQKNGKFGPGGMPKPIRSFSECVESGYRITEGNPRTCDAGTFGVFSEAVINWQAYKNEKYGLEFQYPQEWKIESRELMTSLGHKDYIQFNSGFSVDIWDTTTYSFEQLKAAPPGGIFPESVKEKQIILDGNLATEVSYVSAGDAGSGSAQAKQITFLKNNLVYSIECLATDCEKIIPTFKIAK